MRCESFAFPVLIKIHRRLLASAAVCDFRSAAVKGEGLPLWQPAVKCPTALLPDNNCRSVRTRKEAWPGGQEEGGRKVGAGASEQAKAGGVLAAVPLLW